MANLMVRGKGVVTGDFETEIQAPTRDLAVSEAKSFIRFAADFENDSEIVDFDLVDVESGDMSHHSVEVTS